MARACKPLHKSKDQLAKQWGRASGQLHPTIPKSPYISSFKSELNKKEMRQDANLKIEDVGRTILQSLVAVEEGSTPLGWRIALRGELFDSSVKPSSKEGYGLGSKLIL